MARHRILVVDDEDNLRDVLVEVLKRDGHEVDSALDGDEGLRRAEAHRYDLVVTDLRMPNLEGPELYRAIRERYADNPPRFMHRGPHGYSNKEVIAADLEAGGFKGAKIETVATSAPTSRWRM